MADTTTPHLSARAVKDLKAFLETVGYQIRYAKGGFRSSDCVVKSDRIILLNSLNPPEVHQITLAHVFNSLTDEPDRLTPELQQQYAKLRKSLKPD